MNLEDRTLGRGGEKIFGENLSQADSVLDSFSDSEPFLRSAEVGRHEEIPISSKEESK